MPKSLALTLILVALTVNLTACGKKDADKAHTQVVVKVNGDEISIHQLNFQLSRLGQLNKEQANAASKQVLERLVDQQLILQKAKEAKLDRDPRVVQAIENAKREILVQAYVEQQLSGAKKPTQAEVDDFFNKHPELFEKRRVYRLQELAVAVGQDKLAEIENAVKSAKNPGEIASWLKEKNYQFTANANVRTAEQLPLGLLPKLNQMKDGEMVILPNQNSINIVLLAGSQEQPITKDKATPMIEQFLLAQRRTELGKKENDRLRSTAKIEYLGTFAEMNSRTDKAAAIVTPAPKPVAKQGDSAHIEKGLAGL